ATARRSSGPVPTAHSHLVPPASMPPKIVKPLGSSALDVEPGAARAGIAEALAPRGERLAGVRDGDLSVVAVDLVETVRAAVARRAGRSVGDLERGRRGRAAVGRAAVPDVPRVRVVAAGGLHVPQTERAAERREPRAGRVFAGDRDRRARAPGPAGVRRGRDVDALRAAGRLRALVGEDEVAGRIGDDRGLADVEVRLAA